MGWSGWFRAEASDARVATSNCTRSARGMATRLSRKCRQHRRPDRFEKATGRMRMPGRRCPAAAGGARAAESAGASCQTMRGAACITIRRAALGRPGWRRRSRARRRDSREARAAWART
eukprot:scaffold3080_cov78-Isochrysis_galbana.AAC.4